MKRAPEEYDHPRCENLECNGPVIRKDGESIYHYKARHCCSPQCLSQRNKQRARDERIELLRKMELEHPPCVICGAPVHWNERDQVYKYVDRQTCGQKSCIRALQARKNTKEDGEERAVPEIPKVEVDLGMSFAAHNLRFKSDPRRVTKPFTQTYGVSSIWNLRGGAG